MLASVCHIKMGDALCVLRRLFYRLSSMCTRTCRLQLPGRVVEDGRERAKYDVDSGKLPIIIKSLLVFPQSCGNSFVFVLIFFSFFPFFFFFL